MKYFLAFDVGTTAMKCILFDESLMEVICINEEYSLMTSEDSFVEMEPEIYFITFCKCVKAILDRGIPKESIVSVTFTTQGETLIPIDRLGNPLRNAIVWLDARAEEEAQILSSSIPKEDMYQATGLSSVDGALPAAKLLWIYKHEPEIYRHTYKFLLLEDYFIYRLTGRAVTEQSLVSSTGWYDIFRNCYYERALKSCYIEKEKLPEVLPCGCVVSNVTNEAAERCGLSTRTVVVTGAMDQIASAIGAGNIREGIITETTGTALVIGATVEKPEFDFNQPVTIYKHYNEKYIYMPFCNTAGIVQKWFKDTIVPDVNEIAQKEGVSPYDIVTRMADASPAGSNGIVLFPHFSGKNEPDASPNAKGILYGLQIGTRREDLARSVLEGVAFMLREILEMRTLKNLQIAEIRSLGGGSYSELWNKIKASTCKKRIVTTGYAQTTALGAAILGAVATETYESVEAAVATLVKKEQAVMPDSSLYEVYDCNYNKYKKIGKIFNLEEGE